MLELTVAGDLPRRTFWPFLLFLIMICNCCGGGAGSTAPSQNNSVAPSFTTALPSTLSTNCDAKASAAVAASGNPAPAISCSLTGGAGSAGYANGMMSYTPASCGSAQTTAEVTCTASNGVSPSAITKAALTIPAEVVKITAPSAGSTVGGTVALSVSVSGMSAPKVQFKIDGKDVGTALDTTNGVASASVDTNDNPDFANGAHSITATATSTGGRTVTSTATSITVNNTPRVMENLGRGVIAVRSANNSVYVGWRMLAIDRKDVAYNLYRTTNGATARVNSSPLSNTTDYVDTGADLASANSYFVRAVVNGVEQPSSASWTLTANAPVQQYIDVPIQVQPGGTVNCADSSSSYTQSINDGSIGDLDGDGEYEIVIKWEPSNAKDNSLSGCTGPTILDAYKLNGTRLWSINLGPNIRSGAHYTQFLVYDLDGDGKAELVVKTADGTVDGTGHLIGEGNQLWADAKGYILSGPEYLTVFDGKTGAALATTDYVPGRGDVCSWGDCYGNRVDRFLAAVAYLDGVHPSIVMARGYYTRAVLAAWDWRGGQLTSRWVFDSADPSHPEYKAYEDQGSHSLSIADVNGDGKDEIVYGAAVINNDGTGLYATGWGHGDALHVSRFDPNNPDPLVFTIHEGCKPYGKTLRNARTGALIAGTDPNCGSDPSRGMIAAIDPDYNGAYFWGGGTDGGYALYNLTGAKVSSTTRPSSTNFAVWWDADLLRELENNVSVTRYTYTTNKTETLLTCYECVSNNSTKATPVLAGDIFGDWREEVIWRTPDNQHLRIYTTTIPASNRMYTLLQDSQYRLALVWQNVAYNQPPWPSFYIGPGMSSAPRPNISYPANLSGSITGKSGPANARTWTIAVTNSGTAAANGAEVQGILLTPLSGACMPSVKTAFPLALGDIAAGGTATATVSIDFSACPASMQFTVDFPLRALQGGAMSLLAASGETQ